jgi:transposase
MDATKFDTLTSWRSLMKAGPDRKYTVGFREAVVRQVLDWRPQRVARSPQLGEVGQDAGQLGGRGQAGPAAAQASAGATGGRSAGREPRLRQENARLKVEREIPKKAAAASFSRVCFA